MVGAGELFPKEQILKISLKLFPCGLLLKTENFGIFIRMKISVSIKNVENGF
jgi:hypothetical protein